MSRRAVSVATVISVVEAATGETRRSLLSARKDDGLVRARYAVWWLAVRMTELSITNIGRLTNRAETGVRHGLRRAEELRDSDPLFLAATDAMLAALLAAERDSRINFAAGPDPLAAAERIVSAPDREAVRVSVAEITAMAELVIELVAAQSNQENFDAA